MASEALHLSEPDGNGVELYRDRPEEHWLHAREGRIEMYIRSLDVARLLSEGESSAHGS